MALASEIILRLAPDFFANEKAEVYIQAKRWAEVAFETGRAARDGEINGLRQAYMKQLDRFAEIVEAVHKLKAVKDCPCELCKAVSEMKDAFENGS